MTANQHALATTRKLPLYAQDADRPYEGDPWTRQKNESKRQHEAFLVYLSLENRTYVETDRIYCAKYGTKPNPSRIGNWAARQRWQERALAHDNFLTAATVAANKRRLVKLSTEHADELADIRSVLTLPLNKLRERIKAQGDSFSFIDAMDDADLMKLARSFALDVPGVQKAEREALGATSDTVVPRAELKLKGDLVRRMLADGTVRELAERVAFEVVAPITTDDDQTG